MSRSLHDAILSGSEDEVIARLNMGEDVNQSFPPRHSSPLHSAIHSGDEKVVQLLIGRGAAVNQGDKEGLTPLALAISQDKRSMVKLLSAAGGTKKPSSLPALDEKPDPLFSHPPPWVTQNCTEVKVTDKAKSVQTKESLYGFLKKGSKVFATKPVNAVSDSNKKTVEEVINKKEDKIPEQNLFPTVNDDSNGTFDIKEETDHLDTLKEKGSSDTEVLITKKEDSQNDTKGIKIGCNKFKVNIKTKILSKKGSVNCDDKEEKEDNTKSNNKFSNLIETFSSKSKQAKDNKQKTVTIKEEVEGDIEKEIPGPIEKIENNFKNLKSKLTKQDKEITEQVKETQSETKPENERPEEISYDKEEKKDNTKYNNKFSNLIETLCFKSKHAKENKQKTVIIKEEVEGDKDKEIPGPIEKIENNFKNLKSKLTKKDKEITEQVKETSGETKPENERPEEILNDKEEKEDNSKSNNKFNNLIETLSSKSNYAKENKQKTVTIKEEVEGEKDNEIPGPIEKIENNFKKLKSRLTKKDKEITEQVKETQIETKPENERPEEILNDKEEKKYNTKSNNKFSNLIETLSSKSKHAKDNKQKTVTIKEEVEGDIEKEIPGPIEKIEKNFKSLKSKLTKKDKEITKQEKETQAETKTSNMLEQFKTRSRNLFKKESIDENKDVSEDKQKVSKLTGIKLRLSNLGKSKLNPDEGAKTITSNGRDKENQKNNMFSNLMKRGDKSKEEVKTKEASHAQPESLPKFRKDAARKEHKMSKYQWTMDNGQWRKSQSVGL